jgi:hypothetical protein
VVGELALAPFELVPAEVAEQVVRADDRLGEQDRGGRGDAERGPERLGDEVGLGLVLAVGAEPLPRERDRVEPQDVDAEVGEVEREPATSTSRRGSCS